MRVLILGGTLFLGRHIVNAAVRRGHDVSIFHRGRTEADLPARVTRLHGDRDHDVEALRGGRYDVVVDTSAYHPTQIERVAAVLAGVGQYILISTARVYAASPATEATSLHPPISNVGIGASRATYPGLKRACEMTAERLYGDRVSILRPCVLAGPFDPTNRFEYWVRRCARGGQILAPGRSDRLLQILDARDLAEWTLDIAGTGFGVFNAAGPREPLTMERLLTTCIDVARSSARPVWVSDTFLRSHHVRPWIDLPLWVHHDVGPVLQIDASRAWHAGLVPRPLAETARDVLRAPMNLRPLAGNMPAATPIDAEREHELLAAWSGTVQ
jgi:2'-hydroxyisoflavone reductase